MQSFRKLFVLNPLRAYVSHYVDEYDCSICGCTNRVSIKLNKDSPEFVSPIYSCLTTNPTYHFNNKATAKAKAQMRTELIFSHLT